MVFRELVPVRVPSALIAEAPRTRGRAVLTLVVHRDVRVENPLLHPSTPVLEGLAVRPRLRPVAPVGLRTIAVRDRVGADAEVRFDCMRLDVNLADDAG